MLTLVNIHDLGDSIFCLTKISSFIIIYIYISVGASLESLDFMSGAGDHEALRFGT